MSESPIIVIDNGSCTLKAGFAGDDHPTVIVPSAVGLTDFANLSDPEVFERFMDANSSGEIHSRYPISKGNIVNWEDMESVWRHVIEDQLNIIPRESSILISEPIDNSNQAREKMAEILFESIGFDGVNIAISPILPMYAAGKTSGIVLDVGDGITQVVPVWGGYSITNAIRRVDYGGYDVTQMFKEAHTGRQGKLNKTTPLEVFRMIKERVCYINPGTNQNGELKVNSFVLPNGEKIDLGEEVCQCPEFLFDPTKFNCDDSYVGVHQLLYKSIMKTSIDVKKDLYSNIVLSGGSTLFPGFVDRLEKEMKELVPSSVKIDILANPARKYLTWIGGSVLASLSSFPNTLITKESWTEGSGKTALGKLHY